MDSSSRGFRLLIFAHILSLSIGYVSWGNEPIARPNNDVTSYAIILPDPDLAASESGYLFRITVYVTSATDSFRIAILRPRAAQEQRSYVVAALSDFLAFHKTADGDDPDEAPRASSHTVYLPVPLPYALGDQLAFVVGSRVPCPYTVEDPCRFYSRYQTAGNYGRLHPGSLVNTTRSPECRRYSYVADGVSTGSTSSECIPITFGENEATITKKIGTIPRETAMHIYGDSNRTSHTDLCWHVTCSAGQALVISVIYYHIDNDSDLEISHDRKLKPVLKLTGVIGSDTPYHTVRGNSLYIWYRAEHKSSTQSGFETAIYVEEDDDGAVHQQRLITICLAAIAGSILFITVVLTVLRCRGHGLEKSAAASNAGGTLKNTKEKKKKKKKSSNHNDVEMGYDNLISTGGSEIEGKIPRIGYKADNTFLKAVHPPPQSTSLDGQLQGSEARRSPSFESLDIETGRSEVEVLDALEAAIRGAGGSMAPSAEGSLAGELEDEDIHKGGTADDLGNNAGENEDILNDSDGNGAKCMPSAGNNDLVAGAAGKESDQTQET